MDAIDNSTFHFVYDFVKKTLDAAEVPEAPVPVATPAAPATPATPAVTAAPTATPATTEAPTEDVSNKMELEES